jgi:hemoglobin
MQRTVFERVGGFARVRLMVSDFYEKVLDSPVLLPYFEEVDMRRLIDHQTRFFAAVMGGPASFTDEQLARTHHRLRVTDAAFDEMVILFQETLEDHGLGDRDVGRLVAHIEALRPRVVPPEMSVIEGRGISSGVVAPMAPGPSGKPE